MDKREVNSGMPGPGRKNQLRRVIRQTDLELGREPATIETLIFCIGLP
jgi:hypothetical protein